MSAITRAAPRRWTRATIRAQFQDYLLTQDPAKPFDGKECALDNNKVDFFRVPKSRAGFFIDYRVAGANREACVVCVLWRGRKWSYADNFSWADCADTAAIPEAARRALAWALGLGPILERHQ